MGIRRGWPGALAEQVCVPAGSLHQLRDEVDVVAGAMVEPGGNALRAVAAAELQPGPRLLVFGPGTLGLLCGQFALCAGAEVHVIGPTAASLTQARALGGHGAWTEPTLPELTFAAVIDASNGVDVPRRALELVEAGGRLVYIGLAGPPSLIDTRDLVLRDVTAVGILSGSPGLAGAISRYASGAVDPRSLVAATVGLDLVADVLAGHRPAGSGPGPKIHVDPRR